MTYIMITLEINGNNAGLLFTDTDSFMYEIKNEDVYGNFSKDRDIFHCSNSHLSQNVMIILKK